MHPLVRPIHGQDALLDKGYVFLTDPEMQAGLSAAVDELKAVRQSLSVLAGNGDDPRLDSGADAGDKSA